MDLPQPVFPPLPSEASRRAPHAPAAGEAARAAPEDAAARRTTPPGVLVPDLLVMAHFVRTGRVGGAEHMLYNLLRGMDARGARAIVLCSERAQLSPGFVAEIAASRGLSLREAGGGGPRFLAEQRACLDPGARTRAVLFPNYHLPPALPRRLGRTGVVLHDLQYRHLPANFTRRKRLWLRLSHAHALARADRVFVISDFVRDDVLRHHGAHLASRLVVAPNPVSWTRFGTSADLGADPGPRPIPQPYVLSVAAQYPHKNLPALLRGFAELARRERDLRLVLCGQEPVGLSGVGVPGAALRPLAESLGIGGRVLLTGHLDDAALGRWYRHAALFAFPSLFEGFGMPPVEALGFGVPVLASARTALPEVTLGLARLVEEAESPGAWAAHMREALRSGARPGPAGVALVRRTYAPEVCAARYLEALK